MVESRCVGGEDGNDDEDGNDGERVRAFHFVIPFFDIFRSTHYSCQGPAAVRHCSRP
jgi:hypothetical protein